MADTVYPDAVKPAYYPNTTTFTNLLGIKSHKDLQSKESSFTAIRSIELFQTPEIVQQTFDFAHLKAIHHHLFQDLYNWAGKPRSFDFKKGNNVFTPAREMPKYEIEVFTRSIDFSSLQNRPSISHAAQSLAACLGIINIFHPFPEGNGRAQRIFISSLAQIFQYSLDWIKVHPWEIIETSKKVHEGNYVPLEDLMHRIIRDYKKTCPARR